MELERSRVGEKMVIYHLGSGTFLDTQSADNLILSFSPSRTDRDNFLLFIAHLLQGILVQQSEKIKILQLFCLFYILCFIQILILFKCFLLMAFFLFFFQLFKVVNWILISTCS